MARTAVQPARLLGLALGLVMLLDSIPLLGILIPALWGGLYMGLGVAASGLSGLLPTGSLTTLATVGLGLTFGWVALFTTRRMATVGS